MLQRSIQTDWDRSAGGDPDREPRDPHAILAPGRNCWRVETAERASVLIDAEDYFAHLESALTQAHRTITILGWDFDGRIRLRPEKNGPELGDFLRSLVETRPQLEIRILIWSVAVLHAPGAPLPLILGAPWQDHPRITLKLDSRHPIYGAHHQKIVVVDDELAFVGGMDLTVRRWDSRRHRPGDERRRSPEGTPYGPVHDVQAVVDGPAAVALGDLARERWRVATGERLDPPSDTAPVWPAGLDPDFLDEPFAIARTAPAWGPLAPLRETADLTADALRAARRTIYIEAQYLTARYVREILAEHLQRDEGPEIVVVITYCARGIFEKMVMGINGERMIRYLNRRDRHGRFRVYYPAVPGSESECPIHVHAKVIVVDDVFLRVGSSNLNNRSVGLDTECDIAVEGTRAEARRGILAIRDRLLGEHLDALPDVVAAVAAQEGSLIGAIERLNEPGQRNLRLAPAFGSRGATRSMAGTFLLDPARPFEPLWFLKRED